MGAFVADTSSSSPTEDAPSGRSFFSRFSLPLRSRTRNLADFHIRPDEPHRHYQVGDSVRGAVILTILKPIRITHLTVALHGYVRVFKGPGVSEPIPSPPTTSRLQYHGNGHASLFQDEQVLSGEGKLDPGKYEFNFDLVFPEKSLPSSIDFERGTISYVVTATLTRPTPISPLSTCDRKVSLVEVVDIGPISAPRPRTIYLEPISKRTRRKKPAGPDKVPPAPEPPPDPVPDPDVAAPSVLSEDPTHDLHAAPRSPVQSDIRSEFSGDSAVSTSTGLSVRGTESSQGTNAIVAQPQIVKMQVDDKTITATIELLKGGVLPGDTVPVKVSVQHIKRIKSMHGVIVTMYRQGRIDSAPPPALFSPDEQTREDAQRLDDYYPRSRTGLAGLSLSSTTSLSVFRKDLSQAVAPLFIDPITLNTTVTASVKVPDNVFPTIKGVPGEMISFKYQVEVIVDLGGRLANQLQTASSSRVGQTGITANGSAGDGAVISSWGGSVVDTDQLRREKGVISVVFEVIVGTMDSTRQRARGANRRPPSPETYQKYEEPIDDEPKTATWQGVTGEEYGDAGTYSASSSRPPGVTSNQQGFGPAPESNSDQVPVYVPPPEALDESSLPEKERWRRAEARLLPSQPGDPGPAAASEPNSTGEGSHQPGDGLFPPVPITAGHSQGGRDDAGEGPSAPTLADLSAEISSAPEGDKQELERQRLLNEASAPPEFPEDYDGTGEGASHQAINFEPTAPVLTDDEEYGRQYTYQTVAGPSTSNHPSGQEPLPRYER